SRSSTFSDTPWSTCTASLPSRKVLRRSRHASTSLIAQRLGGIHAGGAPARIERRKQGERERYERNRNHVARLQIGRQVGDVVHLPRQELEVEETLEERHH